MSKTQKDKINQLLNEKGKKKRELAAFLEIHENGINRLINNPNISKKRLEQIAEFLKIDISTLLHSIYAIESEELLEEDNPSSDIVNDSEISEELILKLSEIIKYQKMISDLEKKNGEHLTQIINLLTKKF